jgi:hypothetical protein
MPSIKLKIPGVRSSMYLATPYVSFMVGVYGYLLSISLLLINIYVTGTTKRFSTVQLNDRYV